MIFYCQKGQSVFANNKCVTTRKNKQGMHEVILVGINGGQLVLGEYSDLDRAQHIVSEIRNSSADEYDMPKA